MFTGSRCVFLVSAALFVAVEGCSAEERKGSDLSDQLPAAVKKGAEYLKQAQRDGNWEEQGKPFSEAKKGGVTSLAMLALLDSGVKPDEAVIKKGLDYLRKIEPEFTYVVALQVEALSRVKSGFDDKLLIQKNADWLLRCAHRDGKRVLGWGYTARKVGVIGPDNSNTEFAVMALHAAQEAGARLEPGFWDEVRAYYLRTHRSDGGWRYFEGRFSQTTLAMTSAGVCGLALADKHLKDNNENSLEARRRALQYLAQRFNTGQRGLRYCTLWSIARAGRLSGERVFSEGKGKPSHDWYREGVEYLLKHQERDGSWKGDSGVDRVPVVNTSFALLFLSREK